MKKLLSAMLALALLAGCSNSSSGGNSSGGSDTDGKIAIEFWLAQGNNVMDLVNEEIAKFNESQDKYVVTAVQQENYVKTFSNLQAAIAGKNAQDVVLLDTASARQLYEKGALVPFDAFQADEIRDHRV